MTPQVEHRNGYTEPTTQKETCKSAEDSNENFTQGQWKSMYLISFNMVQTLGFLYVIYLTAIMYKKLGYASFSITYDNLGSLVKLLHILQILETVHPMVGLTKGTPFVAFFQLLGRYFILYLMIDPEPRMQSKAIVPYLYVVWSTIEVIRHAYYISQLVEKEISLLTWLRYSAWIILYPMGIFGEAAVMIKNIPYFREPYSVSLPNTWNIEIDMSFLLILQTFILVGPTMYILTSHMYKIRVKKMVDFRFKPLLVSKSI